MNIAQNQPEPHESTEQDLTAPVPEAQSPGAQDPTALDSTVLDQTLQSAVAQDPTVSLPDASDPAPPETTVLDPTQKDPGATSSAAPPTADTASSFTQPEAARTPAEAPAPAPKPAGQDKRTGKPLRTGPRTGPIVWGALILAFCAYAGQLTFGTGGVDGTTWLIVTVFALGTLLLGVGLAVILRNRK